MRLIFVPLTRDRSILYCQRALLPKVRSKPRLDDRFAAKAAKTWASFESSQTTWKKKLVSGVNWALERIPYEEWALKTVPPRNMYMRKLQETNDHVSPKEFEAAGLSAKDLEPLELVYPATAVSFEDAKSEMLKIASTGVDKHRKQMLYCAIGLPLTLPVALIPVVPNIPGFYILYRLWSNWKAWEGAKHLKLLLADSHLKGSQLPALDHVYRTGRPELVTPEQLKVVKRIFEIDGLSQELTRAYHQCQKAQQREQDKQKSA